MSEMCQKVEIGEAITDKYFEYQNGEFESKEANGRCDLNVD